MRRSAALVDSLVIGIGIHPGKTPLFSTDEKTAMIKAETKRRRQANYGTEIEVVTFDGLTVDAARRGGRDDRSSAACATAPISTTRCRCPA